MRPLLCASVRVLLIAAALLAPASARAQTEPAAAFTDRPIHAVTITIEGKPSTDRVLLDSISTRPGMPLKLADVRQSIIQLYTLARFANIQVEGTEAGAGVDLQYALTPVHPVTRVEFHGELGLPESALRTRMTERLGPTPPVSRSDDVVAALVDLYHQNGYLKAAVSAEPPLLDHVHESATLVFDVNTGPRATIAHATVTGTDEPPAQSAARLGLTPGAPYIPAELQRRIDTLIGALKQRGFYEAAARTDAHPNADRTEADVAVAITTGPHVSVQITGDQIPAEKLPDLVPIEREGSVDPDLLDQSAHNITEYFQQLGYWKAAVSPPEQTPSDNKLVIVFHVSRGRLYRVTRGGVQVNGARSISIGEMRPLMKLARGDPFISGRLDATVSAIKQLYLTRGFASVNIQAAENETAPGLVTPVLTIQEGPRVLVGAVTVTGNRALKTDYLLRDVQTKPGAPYYAPTILADRDRIQVDYLNAGYAAVDVTVPPATVTKASGGERANIAFNVTEGPQTIVQHIFVNGNTRTETSVIEHELRLHEGQPLGLSNETESRRRLDALGLFRRVQIATVSHGDPSKTDVVVTVEEALQTTIGYGGGFEVDRLLVPTVSGTSTERYEFAPRGFFEIGRRNLGGKNRSADLYTRLGLRPDDSNPEDPKQFGFAEYRVVGTYREPQAFGGFGDLTATAAVEQGVRTSFDFTRQGLNAEVAHRISPKVRASLRYSFDETHLFDQNILPQDQITVDRLFSQVRLSAISLALSRDTRDDLLEPQHGALLSADATFAARAIGSQVGFTKTFLQGFIYRNLGKPHLVFAGGARLGVANAFPVLAPDPTTGVISLQSVELPAAERFFAGGDTTIRGYALDSIGRPDTISPQGFPIGGDAEVILNAELRAPVHGPFGVVGFVDGGNVFAHAADLDLTHMLGSVGFGGRYRSPIGPIRVDIGFKLKRRIIGGQLEPAYALHFSIGEAF